MFGSWGRVSREAKLQSACQGVPERGRSRRDLGWAGDANARDRLRRTGMALDPTDLNGVAGVSKRGVGGWPMGDLPPGPMHTASGRMQTARPTSLRPARAHEWFLIGRLRA